MKRTPLKQRILPAYTAGEECANMVTHIVGGGLAVLIAVTTLLVAVYHHSVYGIVSSAIYGFTMIALYTVSSIYHGLRASTAKKVFQVIDHCTIYMLIAGTYTPILLSLIRVEHPVVAWTVFGVEWGVAFLAAVLTAIDLKRFAVFSMICYIVMGWCIVSVLKMTITAMTPVGFAWLLAGGICYTVGAVLYVIGAKRRYYHTVFHVFVDIGSVLQAYCILAYVL